MTRQTRPRWVARQFPTPSGAAASWNKFIGGLPRPAAASTTTWPRQLTAGDFFNGGLRGVGFADTFSPLPSAADFDSVAALGANHARVFVVAAWNGSSYAIASADLARLDATIDQLAARRIYTLPVVSVARADMPWRFPARQATYATLLGGLAQRYAGRREVAAIDMMNEPDTENDSFNQLEDYLLVINGWRTLATACIDAMRFYDPARVAVYEVGIVASPSQFTESTVPIPRPEVVYSPHVYDPFAFTHQNIAQYQAGTAFGPPVAYGSAQAAALTAAIQQVATWRPDLPKYVGEFSAVNWAPAGDSARFIADCITQFRGFGMSWSYHQWRGFPGWDAEAIPNGAGAYTRGETASVVALRAGLQA